MEITAEVLKGTYQRIEDLKKVRTESWAAWHVLNDLEQRDKEQGREHKRLFSIIDRLNYEIRANELYFKELSRDFIKQIVEG